MLSDEAEVVARLLRREQSADDGLRHGKQGIGEAGPMVAGMKQQLGQAALGPEHAVAGDRAVANQKAVEILAHRRGK